VPWQPDALSKKGPETKRLENGDGEGPKGGEKGEAAKGRRGEGGKGGRGKEGKGVWVGGWRDVYSF